MTQSERLWALVSDTVMRPIEGFEKIRGLGLSPQRAIDLNLLIICLAVLSQYSALFAVNSISDVPIDPLVKSPGPLADAGFMSAISLFLITGIWVMGLVNGRNTSFLDVAVMYGWFQLLLITAQILLIPVTVLLPGVGAFAAVLLAIFIQPYYLVCGTMSVHGFDQPLSVLGGLILVGIVSALLLSPVMLLLGMELAGLSNV